MNEEYLRPPQKDIQWAMEVELNILPEEMELYLECMNNIPMSKRKNTPRDLRDGCILTGVFWHCKNNI